MRLPRPLRLALGPSHLAFHPGPLPFGRGEGESSAAPWRSEVHGKRGRSGEWSRDAGCGEGRAESVFEQQTLGGAHDQSQGVWAEGVVAQFQHGFAGAGFGHVLTRFGNQRSA